MNQAERLSAFMSCDVRGRYPTAVNEALFGAIGRGLPEVWPGSRSTLVVGDVRASTPSLISALVGGLAPDPVTVSWPLSTPLAYFVSRQQQLGRTLIVTASHNPADYNGLKLLHGQRPPTADDLRRLRLSTERILSEGGALAPAQIRPADPSAWVTDYVGRLSRLAPATRPLRLVVDPGNGCLSGLAARALVAAGHQVSEINGEVNGGFPSRGPDPTAPGALSGLSGEVERLGADLGVAFDGDGDRAVFVDGEGARVPGDVVSFLLAAESAETDPDAPIVLDVRTSRSLSHLLQERGVTVVWSYPGHALVRTAMAEHGASFAGETSGHYFFGDLGHDDGLYAALRLARLVGSGGSLADLVASLPQVHSLDEMRLPFAGEPAAVYDAIEQACPGAIVERGASGIGLEWDGAWVLVRPSITEPLLTVRGEADSLEDLARLKSIVSAALAGAGVQLLDE